MKLFFCLILLLVPFVQVFGQQPPSEKEKQKFVTARIFIEQKKYDEASVLLQKLIKSNGGYNEARAALAELYMLQNDTASAILQYETILQKDKNYGGLPYYNLGLIYQNRQQFEVARRYFEQVAAQKNIAIFKKNDAKMRANQCVFAPEAMRNPVAFLPKNLGDSINTEYNEYLPSISADGALLIYTRRAEQEDFFMSVPRPEGSGWELATALPFPINTSGNEGAHCLSPDGKQLYFTGCYRPDGLGSCDIYVANRIGDGWSKPQNLGDFINTKSWETQPSISANGQTLYFVSNRAGGLGGSDIWVSQKDSAGNWGYPTNLGEVVNSVFDEISPYIHPNNHDLYFASKGHIGLGDFDLFLSKKENDAWTAPKNLGYPINTTQSESSLSVSLNGKIGYFASERSEGRGGKDIYSFEMPLEVRPDTATYYTGLVFDAQTKRALQAKIEIEDLNTKKIIYRQQSDLKTGSFLVCLEPDSTQNYLLNITKKGYAFYSENIQKNTSSQLLVGLNPLKIGQSSVLKNTFFETNSFEIAAQSVPELQELCTYLQMQPSLKIEIQGHTDNVGNEAHNLKLSQQRAKAVYDFLLARGVPASQISYKGYGSKQPIADNDLLQTRSQNRRTQVLIIDF